AEATDVDAGVVVCNHRRELPGPAELPGHPRARAEDPLPGALPARRQGAARPLPGGGVREEDELQGGDRSGLRPLLQRPRRGRQRDHLSMAIKIRRARKSDAKGFNACVGAVAEERRYIAQVRRPPLAASKKWMAF